MKASSHPETEWSSAFIPNPLHRLAHDLPLLFPHYQLQDLLFFRMTGFLFFGTSRTFSKFKDLHTFPTVFLWKPPLWLLKSLFLRDAQGHCVGAGSRCWHQEDPGFYSLSVRELSCCIWSSVGFFLCFPPTVKNMHIRWMINSKFPLSEFDGSRRS